MNPIRHNMVCNCIDRRDIPPDGGGCRLLYWDAFLEDAWMTAILIFFERGVSGRGIASPHTARVCEVRVKLLTHWCLACLLFVRLHNHVDATRGLQHTWGGNQMGAADCFPGGGVIGSFREAALFFDGLHEWK